MEVRTGLFNGTTAVEIVPRHEGAGGRMRLVHAVDFFNADSGTLTFRIWMEDSGGAVKAWWYDRAVGTKLPQTPIVMRWLPTDWRIMGSLAAPPAATAPGFYAMWT